MTLEEAAAAVKNLLSEDTYVTAGHIDSSLTETIGVYSDKRAPSVRQIAVGGEEATLIRCYYFTVLIHWTNSPVKAEEKAKEMFKKLCEANFPHVSYADISEPVFAGKDERGIFEYVINFKLYERKE